MNAMMDSPGESETESVRIGRLMGLRREEQRIVERPIDSSLFITGGPGTGKSRTLVARIVRYILERGTPRGIVVILFTDEEVKEMKSALCRYTGDPYIEYKIKCGTFDTLCLHYIQAYGTRIGMSVNFNIVSDSDRFSIIKDLLTPNETIHKELREVGFIPDVRHGIFGFYGTNECNGRIVTSWKVNGMISGFKLAGWTNGSANGLEHAKYKPYLIFYQHYQRYLKENKMCDLDDLLFKCIDVLKQEDWAVKNIEGVFVDELQNANEKQMEFIQCLSLKRHYVTFAGDPNQKIDLFRRTNATIARNFQENYRGIVEFHLRQSLRVPRPILEYANGILSFSEEGAGMNEQTVGKGGAYLKPIVCAFRNDIDERNGIRAQILHLCGSKLKGRQVFDYKDVVILCDGREQLEAMSVALSERSIPFIMADAVFWRLREVNTLIDYLKVIKYGNDRAAIIRSLREMPPRGITKQFFTKILPNFPEGEDLLDQLDDVSRNPDGQFASDMGMTEQTMGINWTQSIQKYVKLVRACQQRLETTPTFQCLGEVVRSLNETLKLHETVDDDDDEHEDDDDRENVKKALRKVGQMQKELCLLHIEQLAQYITGMDDIRREDRGNVDNESTQVEVNLSEAETVSESEVDEDERIRRMQDEEAETQSGDETPTPLSKFLHIQATTRYEGRVPGNFVTLSTIHEAKGREWPIVFIMHCVDSVVANTSYIQLTEICRLYYVAATRASGLLYCSSPLKSTYHKKVDTREAPLRMLVSQRVEPYFQKTEDQFPNLSSEEFSNYASLFNKFTNN
jgi:DNA helicase-2/ATP-dependent DNA helicase PcrA